ncbi:tetratricopeptide (TPR) repeat protein [Xanthomonas arboricola]|uniref:tetratricopeptide repeat protein n=1 Tax=Xanthomonas cannabis TaxID=1885674 RepID=UPI0017F1FEDA|nr:tetratricopeptide repeat protein [Xanthomonas cannabis]MBB3804657.1 tetratricopeptide (TPR) repeat protein [Xanthomonas cannabis]
MTQQQGTEQLLARAARAMLDANDAESSALLEALLEQDPECAQAHYLLGAHRAQLGDLALAESAFHRALQLSPELVMARFQLGQLLLVTGRNSEAVRMLEPLSESIEGAIGSYASGLISIANDHVDLAISQLQMGLTQVQPIAALQADMQDLVSSLAGATGPLGSMQTNIGGALPGASMLLSNYSRHN